jgi:large exoprotein involved in heme utilization and adhesion
LLADSNISANSEGTAADSGDAGDITVVADRLQLTEGSQIASATFGSGDGGTLRVEARDILLTDQSEAGFRSGIVAIAFGSGQAGDIFVNAQDIELREGGAFNASSQGTAAGSGDAGDITVKADSLRLIEGGDISSVTFGPGQGGNLRVEARDILLTGQNEAGFFSAILASSQGTVADSGDGGNITVKADRLRLSEGAQIASGTFGPGQGGSVRVEARDILLTGDFEAGFFSGFRASSEGTEADSGDAGDITVVADRLQLSGDDGARISVETEVSNAGDIHLNVGTLLHLRDDSAITTSVAGGQGDGGNITIDPTFVVLDGSSIVANAVRGRGGNINIVADHLFRTPDSLIEASSELGIQGTVEIKAPDRDVSAGLLALPANFFGAATVLMKPCAERFEEDTTRLVVKKYDVLPDSPYALRVYLPSAGFDPAVSSDATESTDSSDLYTAWDPRAYTCAFDLE